MIGVLLECAHQLEVVLRHVEDPDFLVWLERMCLEGCGWRW